MLQYETVSKEFARSNKNHSMFLLLFGILSIGIGLYSSMPTKLYGYVAGAAFLFLAAKYFKTYFRWSSGMESDENIISELKNTYTARRIISNVESVNVDEISRIVAEETNWLQSYINYAMFGAAWGILYIFVTLLRNQQFSSIGEWLFAVFFNSIILFVLGKSAIDYLEIRINSDYLRLPMIHFISYLPIFILAGIFWGRATMTETPKSFFAEPAIRLVLIVAIIIAYKLSGRKLPA